MSSLLEQDILKTIQLSIQKAIANALSRYDCPLNKLVNVVIEEHSAEIKQTITEALEQSIRTDEFKAGVREAVSHTVGRRIISGSDSLIQKGCNELEQDAAFRAKLTLAISNLVNEHSERNRHE